MTNTYPERSFAPHRFGSVEGVSRGGVFVATQRATGNGQTATAVLSSTSIPFTLIDAGTVIWHHAAVEAQEDGGTDAQWAYRLYLGGSQWDANDASMLATLLDDDLIDAVTTQVFATIIVTGVSGSTVTWNGSMFACHAGPSTAQGTAVPMCSYTTAGTSTATSSELFLKDHVTLTADDQSQLRNSMTIVQFPSQSGITNVA